MGHSKVSQIGTKMNDHPGTSGLGASRFKRPKGPTRATFNHQLYCCLRPSTSCSYHFLLLQLPNNALARLYYIIHLTHSLDIEGCSKNTVKAVLLSELDNPM